MTDFSKFLEDGNLMELDSAVERKPQSKGTTREKPMRSMTYSSPEKSEQSGIRGSLKNDQLKLCTTE